MKFVKGNKVEVLKRNGEQHSSWFPATILSTHKEKYAIRHDLFRTSKGKLVEELVNAEDVRPCPPLMHGEEQLTVGDIAEVLDLHSWRLGKVVKVLMNNYVVVRLLGSIQLKQFLLSDIRVQQAWQKDQWVIIDQVGVKKQLENVNSHIRSKHEKESDEGAYQGLEGVRNVQRFKHDHVDFVCPPETVKRNLGSRRGFFLGDAIRSTNKKRSRRDEIHQQKRRALPKSEIGVCFLKDIASQNCMHNSDKNRLVRYSQLGADNDKADSHTINYSSIPAQFNDHDIECSVASCSGNELPCYSSKRIRKHSKNTATNFLADAMSSCPSESGKEDQSASGDELAASIHELELYAYQSTMQALHASGPLSWEQESLLTNLRMSLNISNEEHLLHLRYLLST